MKYLIIILLFVGCAKSSDLPPIPDDSVSIILNGKEVKTTDNFIEIKYSYDKKFLSAFYSFTLASTYRIGFWQYSDSLQNGKTAVIIVNNNVYLNNSGFFSPNGDTFLSTVSIQSIDNSKATGSIQGLIIRGHNANNILQLYTDTVTSITFKNVPIIRRL